MMRIPAYWTLSVALGLILTVFAQTYTACDPTNVTCPPTPGLDTSYYLVDFTTVTSTPSDWNVPTWCRVTYNTKGRQNGAELEFLERYDSQQLISNFYFLFGRAEFVVQAAPGPGIISDMMLLSDDLDEVDWEFRGTLQDEVQTGWFGKGVTGLYNHSITPEIPTPMTQFHTYAYDWTAERVNWEADGVVIRTLQASDCLGLNNQYPQTPMKAMVGLWDAGDPDHYDPWSAGMTPIPPPDDGYSFYVKSVKIWNSNPAACYNWTDHTGDWQSINAVNDEAFCGMSASSSSTTASMSSAVPSLTASSTNPASLSAFSSAMLTSSGLSSSTASASGSVPSVSSAVISSSASGSSMSGSNSSTLSTAISVSSEASSSIMSSAVLLSVPSFGAVSSSVASSVASSNAASSVAGLTGSSSSSASTSIASQLGALSSSASASSQIKFNEQTKAVAALSSQAAAVGFNMSNAAVEHSLASSSSSIDGQSTAGSSIVSQLAVLSNTVGASGGSAASTMGSSASTSRFMPVSTQTTSINVANGSNSRPPPRASHTLHHSSISISAVTLRRTLPAILPIHHIISNDSVVDHLTNLLDAVDNVIHGAALRSAQPTSISLVFASSSVSKEMLSSTSSAFVSSMPGPVGATERAHAMLGSICNFPDMTLSTPCPTSIDNLGRTVAAESASISVSGSLLSSSQVYETDAPPWQLTDTNSPLVSSLVSRGDVSTTMSTPVIAIPSSFLGNLASSTVQIVLDQQKSFLSSLLMSSAYGKGHATGVAIATEVRTFTATLTQSGSLPYAGTRQASASSASAYSAASANHFHINTSSNANFSFIKAPPMISPLSTTSNRFGERLNSNEPIAAQTSPYHGNANSNQHGYHHAHIHSGYLINSGEAVAITQATKDSKGTLIGGSVTAISPNADEGSPHSEDIVSATDSPYANAGEGLPSGPDTNNAASDIDQKDPMNAGMSVAPTSGPYAAAQTSYASSNESFGVGGAGSMNTTAPLPFYSGAWLGRSLGSVIYVLGFAICGVFAL